MPIADQTVATFTTAIASTDPSPGAGAAGAVALSLAVACVRKAVRMSLKHEPDDEALRRADDGLIAIATATLDGADADAALFPALLEAMRLPQESDVQRQARRDAVRVAAQALIAAGERLVDLGEQVERIVDAAAPSVERVMRNDLTAARALVAAASAIQRANAAESRRYLD